MKILKDYEIYSNLKVPKGSNIVLRLDGRKFHTLAKTLNLEKPYDSNFAKLMIEVCKDLFNEFSPKFIYTFSDEINIFSLTGTQTERVTISLETSYLW